MAHPILPLTLSLLAFSARADPGTAAGHHLEPCINGAVSANGQFPSQATEEEFGAYLRWTLAACRTFPVSGVGAAR